MEEDGLSELSLLDLARGRGKTVEHVAYRRYCG